ncbi:MAG: hypothetical protein B6D62_01200 [Candidatus Cloacimonas sp. 4484_275]|nr:MAG: hypothetical protein B6D62_01200 [Candidatus Cloacimonas sp. 4484_275]
MNKVIVILSGVVVILSGVVVILSGVEGYSKINNRIIISRYIGTQDDRKKIELNDKNLFV